MTVPGTCMRFLGAKTFSAKAFTWLAAAGLTLASPAFAARFVDTSNNWTERSINVLSDKGVIPAEADGKFRPNDPLTRAQLAAWLVKILELDGQQAPAESSQADRLVL
jgi:large repetitive protein